jgi:rRNA-processing protein FCF1
MERNSSESSKAVDFVFDTSAFLSLESIELLEKVLKQFSAATTSSVIRELDDFAEHDDLLGNIAKRILKLRHLFAVEDLPIIYKLKYVSTTDEELYNVARAKNIPLVTDDTKLTHHTEGKISRAFSTLFLRAFVDAELITKQEALTKLELMRKARNWQNNLVYLTSKELLANE